MWCLLCSLLQLNTLTQIKTLSSKIQKTKVLAAEASVVVVRGLRLDYSPLCGSPLRGRLRRSSGLRPLVEPEVLIPVRLKQKPAFRRVPVSWLAD
jgi:hypothetical protein